MMWAQDFSAPMTEKRLLALLATLIGLVGGLLILVDVVDIGRRQNLDLTFVINSVVAIIVGIAVLAGSLLIYRAKYSSGGIINVILGLVALVLPGTSDTGGILAIISGIVGLVASEAGK